MIAPKLALHSVGAVVHHARVPLLLQTMANGAQVAYPTEPMQGGSVCWWDGHEFEHAPVGCPVVHDEIRNRFFMEGFFCSWSCVKAYARRYVQNKVQGLISLWIRRIARAPASAIVFAKEAPHWCCLKRFGGSVSIEQFRALNATHELRHHVVPERSNLFLLGHDCFIEEPKIPVPFFSEYHARQFPCTDDGCFEYPKLVRNSMCTPSRQSRSCHTQTISGASPIADVNNNNTAAQVIEEKGDTIIVPSKYHTKSAASRRRSRVETCRERVRLGDIKTKKVKETNVQKQRRQATNYRRFKASQVQMQQKRSLEGLIRPKNVNNPLVNCMKLVMKPTTK